ncbi:MAG: zinc ribbon domain-containing protein [Myxococcales bacterium]|nr:zinc ribbon domain-containing protein [Myxococcales bacterium]
MFPGASVVCTCGARFDAPLAAHDRASPLPGSGLGPYRDSRSPALAPEPLPCPFCSAPTPPMTRVCPTCDVRLDRVRCAQCFQLQPPGASTCSRCGAQLELEVLLDLLDAPCPRCARPLEGTPDHANIECASCGGLFVSKESLSEILAAAEVRGPFAAAKPEPKWNAPAVALGEVRYLACPTCRKTMNRHNFGRISGVIVDVCRAHGTWFDAGELTRTVEFVARGGLERSRAREAAEHAEEQRRRAEGRAASQSPGFASTPLYIDGVSDAENWRDLLSLLFS